jgi:Na+-driven multidrug efflux pump
MVGYAYGAHNYDRVKESIIKSSGLSLFFITLGWLVMQFQGEWLMRFFTSDPYLVAGGRECLSLATMVIPVMGPLIILPNVLQALGQGTTAMWLSIIRQAAFFLPAIVLLPQWLGLKGVWLAFTLAEFLSALLGLLFYGRLWKKLQVRTRYKVLMAFKKGYAWDRIRAWFKW